MLRPEAAIAATLPVRVETGPGDVDAYLSEMPSKGLTDLAGIHAEYREAAAAFPYEMPPGWSFPSESGLRDIPTTASEGSETSALWERGSGTAEAYLYWQTAVSQAAYEAHLDGDQAGVASLLDTLEAGYRSDVRRTVLEDPAEDFIRIEIAAARNGDFTGLKSVASD
ncbi:hypothetical protein ELQ90_12240 [Labedella phragmitis]|uniref:Uncharacterized protein n=1 Tax=Labedella phragmitis TaxID=2498849 RepID=A0A444PQN0_9MICO|nr:hypothetical protein [Labedella phragmitis]RWZ49534.1 hypothetical protein ELQ90_12240 [Labedella phragmitis]